MNAHEKPLSAEIDGLRLDLQFTRGFLCDARDQFNKTYMELQAAKARIAYLETCQASDLRLIDSLRASVQIAEPSNTGLVQHHSHACTGCPLCISYTPSPAAWNTDYDTAPDGRLLRRGP